MEISQEQTGRLFESVYQGQTDVLKKLLRMGANPNVYDEQKEPLIFIPIVNGDRDILEILLLNERCDINKRNRYGTTPLLLAVEMDDFEMVKLLIKSGSFVDGMDESGKTALLLALEEGKFKIAEYLLKHGSDVNITDALGQSALYLVACSGRSDCTKIIRKILNCGYHLEKDVTWISTEELIASLHKNEKKLSTTFGKLCSKMITNYKHSLTRKYET